MITEDYVSFEVAELLKEKGFDEKCSCVWIINKANNPEDTDGVYKVASPYFMEGESYVSNEDIDRVLKYFDEYYYKDAFLCPTLSVVMKWLREIHNIHIDINTNWAFKDDLIVVGYMFNTHSTINSWYQDLVNYPTYEEACEEAIKYCLENLI